MRTDCSYGLCLQIMMTAWSRVYVEAITVRTIDDVTVNFSLLLECIISVLVHEDAVGQ